MLTPPRHKSACNPRVMCCNHRPSRPGEILSRFTGTGDGAPGPSSGSFEQGWSPRGALYLARSKGCRPVFARRRGCIGVPVFSLNQGCVFLGFIPLPPPTSSLPVRIFSLFLLSLPNFWSNTGLPPLPRFGRNIDIK